MEQWFSTHPTTQERVNNTRAIIAQTPGAQGGNLTTDTRAFQSFRSRVASLPAPADRAPVSARGAFLPGRARGARPLRAAAALAAALVLGGCVNEQREVAIGNQIAAQINMQVPLVQDVPLNLYVNDLGGLIARHSAAAGAASTTSTSWTRRRSTRSRCRAGTCT